MIFFFFCVPALIAHPHVWVDVSLRVDFDKNGDIASIMEIWRYDEMFSMAVIKQIDKNGDGDFDAKEESDLKNLYFSSIERFGFYTHIFVNGKEAKTGMKLKDFSARMSDGNLIYVFTIVPEKPLNPLKSEIDIGIYDSGYYTEFSYEEDPVLITGLSGDGCPFYIFEDDEHPIYFGMVEPETIALCRKKL